MTEKRFEYTAYDDGTESIYDKKEKKYYYDMQLSNIEELLNDLSDENEQLKHDATVLIQANQDYRRENEQLKKDNVHLKVLLDSLQDKYSGLLKLVHGFDKND